jgi:hypothetical protein
MIEVDGGDLPVTRHKQRDILSGIGSGLVCWKEVAMQAEDSAIDLAPAAARIARGRLSSFRPMQGARPWIVVGRPLKTTHYQADAP